MAEAWRESIQVGDWLQVHSSSAGGWLPGTVTKINKERLKVAFAMGNLVYDKTVLRSSLDIRLPPADSPPPPMAMPVGVAVAASGVPQAQRRMEQVPKEVVSMVPGQPPPAAAPPQVTAPPAALAQPPGVAALSHPAPPAVGAPGVAMPTAGPASAGKQDVMRITIGEIFEMKEIVFGELIGSGGFGSVYRGVLRGNEVAVKRLVLGIDGKNVPMELLAEFKKEVENLQGLRHDRLIHYVGVVFELPVVCIVTELASNGSLHSLLHVKRASLDEATRRRLALQIAEGVAFLHGRKPPCVHRDLKSANVVLDGDHHAKLCDFGLTESMEKTHLSRRDAEVGSPRYMAPESFDSRKKLTEKIDVWALGCLMIEVFTDQVPHQDCTTIQQVATKLLINFQPPYADGWEEFVSPAFAQLVNRCFVKSNGWCPGERPTAQGLHDGLEQLDGPLLDVEARGRARAARRRTEKLQLQPS